MIRSPYKFDVLISTRPVLDRTCLLLVLPITPCAPCAPRSADASPLTNQRGACIEKYDFYHFAVSQRIPGIYTYVQLLQQLKDKHLLNIFVKLNDLITRFTGSLFPQLLRHLQNCSYQRQLQIEKLIMTVHFRVYSCTICFSHRSTCFFFCCLLHVFCT